MRQKLLASIALLAMVGTPAMVLAAPDQALLEHQAAQNDPKALIALAKMYLSGTNAVAQDPARAYELLRRVHTQDPTLLAEVQTLSASVDQQRQQLINQMGIAPNNGAAVAPPDAATIRAAEQDTSSAPTELPIRMSGNPAELRDYRDGLMSVYPKILNKTGLDIRLVRKDADGRPVFQAVITNLRNPATAMLLCGDLQLPSCLSSTRGGEAIAAGRHAMVHDVDDHNANTMHPAPYIEVHAQPLPAVHTAQAAQSTRVVPIIPAQAPTPQLVAAGPSAVPVDPVFGSAADQTQAQTRVRDLSARLTDVEARVKTAQALAMSEAQGRVQAQADEQAAVKAAQAADQARQEAVAHQKEAEQQAADVGQQLQAAKARLSALTQQHDDDTKHLRDTAVASIQAQKTTAQQALDNIAARERTAGDMVEAAKAATDRAQAQAQAARQAANDRQDLLNAAQTRLSGFEQSVQTAQAETDRLKQELSSAQADLKAAQTQAVAQKRADDAAQLQAKLSAEHDAEEHKILSAQLQDAMAQAASAKTVAEQSRKEAVRLSGLLKTANGQVDAANARADESARLAQHEQAARQSAEAEIRAALDARHNAEQMASAQAAEAAASKQREQAEHDQATLMAQRAQDANRKLAAENEQHAADLREKQAADMAKQKAEAVAAAQTTAAQNAEVQASAEAAARLAAQDVLRGEATAKSQETAAVEAVRTTTAAALQAGQAVTQAQAKLDQASKAHGDVAPFKQALNQALARAKTAQDAQDAAINAVQHVALARVQAQKDNAAKQQAANTALQVAQQQLATSKDLLDKAQQAAAKASASYATEVAARTDVQHRITAISQELADRDAQLIVLGQTVQQAQDAQKRAEATGAAFAKARDDAQAAASLSARERDAALDDANRLKTRIAAMDAQAKAQEQAIADARAQAEHRAQEAALASAQAAQAKEHEIAAQKLALDAQQQSAAEIAKVKAASAGDVRRALEEAQQKAQAQVDILQARLNDSQHQLAEIQADTAVRVKQAYNDGVHVMQGQLDQERERTRQATELAVDESLQHQGDGPPAVSSSKNTPLSEVAQATQQIPESAPAPAPAAHPAPATLPQTASPAPAPSLPKPAMAPQSAPAPAKPQMAQQQASKPEALALVHQLQAPEHPAHRSWFARWFGPTVVPPRATVVLPSVRSEQMVLAMAPGGAKPIGPVLPSKPVVAATAPKPLAAPSAPTPLAAPSPSMPLAAALPSPPTAVQAKPAPQIPPGDLVASLPPVEPTVGPSLPQGPLVTVHATALPTPKASSKRHERHEETHPMITMAPLASSLGASTRNTVASVWAAREAGHPQAVAAPTKALARTEKPVQGVGTKPAPVKLASAVPTKALVPSPVDPSRSIVFTPLHTAQAERAADQQVQAEMTPIPMQLPPGLSNQMGAAPPAASDNIPLPVQAAPAPQADADMSGGIAPAAISASAQQSAYAVLGRFDSQEEANTEVQRLRLALPSSLTAQANIHAVAADRNHTRYMVVATGFSDYGAAGMFCSSVRTQGENCSAVLR